MHSCRQLTTSINRLWIIHWITFNVLINIIYKCTHIHISIHIVTYMHLFTNFLHCTCKSTSYASNNYLHVTCNPTIPTLT